MQLLHSRVIAEPAVCPHKQRIKTICQLGSAQRPEHLWHPLPDKGSGLTAQMLDFLRASQPPGCTKPCPCHSTCSHAQVAMATVAGRLRYTCRPGATGWPLWTTCAGAALMLSWAWTP